MGSGADYDDDCYDASNRLAQVYLRSSEGFIEARLAMHKARDLLRQQLLRRVGPVARPAHSLLNLHRSQYLSVFFDLVTSCGRSWLVKKNTHVCAQEQTSKRWQSHDAVRRAMLCYTTTFHGS